VKRIYQLYAYENLKLDGVMERMNAEGRTWRSSASKFPRSSIHNMLRDRAYLGEIEFRGQWYPGKQTPLIDRATWDRVQALLGEGNYHSHSLTYSGEFMKCGHCGQWVTGERKTKKTAAGLRDYVYYRCARYTKPGHPRVRAREEEIDRQVLAIFDRMRIEDDSVRDWFRAVLASQTKDSQAESLAMRAELQRQETLLVQQQDRLLNMRIADDIDQDDYARKSTELRDRLASIKLQLDAVDRSHDELAELASKVFELSQTLREKWLTADYAAKRRILEIVCLNCRLDDVILVPTIRKPFDMLAEGLGLRKNRDDRI
jgi:site-specific DNA recombinase